MKSIYWAVDPRDWDAPSYGHGSPMVNHIIVTIETHVRPRLDRPVARLAGSRDTLDRLQDAAAVAQGPLGYSLGRLGSRV